MGSSKQEGPTHNVNDATLMEAVNCLPWLIEGRQSVKQWPERVSTNNTTNVCGRMLRSKEVCGSQYAVVRAARHTYNALGA